MIKGATKAGTNAKRKSANVRWQRLAIVLAGMLGIFCIMTSPVRASETSGESEAQLLIATRQEMTVIEDAEGLLAMAEDPNGCYVLAADIQMEGVEWKPFAFHGTLDGAGFSLLNLTIGETGEAVRETFDGNMKVYDTYFAGLFDELSEGSISNLKLVNLRIDVETDLPCFVGGFAGYMENATIENCSVQGMLQLRAHDRMFGVGGIIGYGCGEINDCSTDVTLVCIDTDATTKDEQFMGGVCAAGYPDMHRNQIAICGFDSDHGYVHDGGLVGMYMFYPKGKKYRGSITDNYVSGKITFYEDNKNRRAYCNGFIGEIMNWDFENGRNKDDFVRDEVYTYDIDLMPHACENPALREEMIAPGCEFGYVKYVCETCGYEETDHYTLKAHDYEWTVVKEATTEEEGLQHGVCRDCGAETEEILPVLPPEPEEPSSERVETVENSPAPTEAEAQDTAELAPADPFGTNKGFVILVSICIVGAACLIVWLICKKGKAEEE